MRQKPSDLPENGKRHEVMLRDAFRFLFLSPVPLPFPFRLFTGTFRFAKSAPRSDTIRRLPLARFDTAGHLVQILP